MNTTSTPPKRVQSDREFTRKYEAIINGELVYIYTSYNGFEWQAVEKEYDGPESSRIAGARTEQDAIEALCEKLIEII